MEVAEVVEEVVEVESSDISQSWLPFSQTSRRHTLLVMGMVSIYRGREGKEEKEGKKSQSHIHKHFKKYLQHTTLFYLPDFHIRSTSPAADTALNEDDLSNVFDFDQDLNVVNLEATM